MIIVPAYVPEGKPRLAFVGEAPSWEEEKTRVPFTGRSGRMFNSLLKAAGIDRGDCLVTNVFNEKLPDNDVANWCVNAKEATALGARSLPPIGQSGFLRPEYHHHLARLRQELQEAGPCLIVPLGGTALWALSGNANVGAVRGTVLAASTYFNSAKLLPTYHPSFVMKQFKYYTVVVGDLQKAVKESERGASIILPERRLLVAPTLADLDAARHDLLRAELLSVDIETGWGQITSIGFAPSPLYSLVVPFLDKRNISRSYWPNARSEAIAWRFVRDILASDVPKLGQNYGGYDFFWLLEKYHLPSRNMSEDTRLMYHALYPELPKSLEFMQGHSSQGAWKHWADHHVTLEKRDN